MKATITTDELRSLLENKEVALIDVLTPEDYADVHISGAQNACVYEMVFLDRIGEIVAGKERLIIVYDASGTTLTAQTAAVKLEQAGYRNVAILAGGCQSWLDAGYPVEHAEVGKPFAATIRDGLCLVDVEKSVLEWTGRNINNRHYGRIALSGGQVVFEKGRLASGSFSLDMKSITNLDLRDDDWRGMLLRHLNSEDFFDVEQYPAIVFELKGAVPIAAATPGTPNVEIAGTLTIKDTSRPLCFPAVVALQEDGSVKAQAALDIDRTLWNVRYGSGKLFERLGIHLVHDLISIELFIVARDQRLK